MTAMIQKATAHQAEASPLEFVMSDETVDRYGDVIVQSGWELGNFKKNPIALFGHSSGFPVGVWKNVRVEGRELRGQLELLPRGGSPRVDELRAFIEAGHLRAVSVGFRPKAAEPIEGSAQGGLRYTKSELVECSLVSIPANPNALQVAKQLNLSDDARKLIFGESADGVSDVVHRAGSGESAVRTPQSNSHSKGHRMSLAQRITDAQARVTSLKDRLTDHINKGAETEDEAGLAATEELSGQIAEAQRSLEVLQRAEAQLASTATPSGAGNGASGQARVPAAVAKKVDPKDYVYRAAVVSLLSHITKQPILDVVKQRYGEDESTRVVTGALVSKAASVPATTTLTGWAAELVQTAVGDFIDTLMPQSVYPRLSALGGRFTFGRNGVISLPSRASTPTVAGSFVGQGAAIPVRQAAFTAVSLTPKKMAVISTFTREIAEHSTPSIEALIRQAMQEDTAVAVDSVLLDATAASTVRPAGLRNGVTGLTPTANGGLAALIGDIGLLMAVLVGANSLRSPVWIMNPLDVARAGMLNANGVFPFRDEIAQGRLAGFPIIQSTSMTATMVALIDAADFFSATGDEPRFDISDQATLHMEDTSPAAISTAGSPNVVAAPVRSLWQTDTIGIRMMLDMNWAMRRTGVVAWMTGVTW